MWLVVDVAVYIRRQRTGAWREDNMIVFNSLPSLILFCCFFQLYFDSCKHHEVNDKTIHYNI